MSWHECKHCGFNTEQARELVGFGVIIGLGIGIAFSVMIYIGVYA